MILYRYSYGFHQHTVYNEGIITINQDEVALNNLYVGSIFDVVYAGQEITIYDYGVVLGEYIYSIVKNPIEWPTYINRTPYKVIAYINLQRLIIEKTMWSIPNFETFAAL